MAGWYGATFSPGSTTPKHRFHREPIRARAPGSTGNSAHAQPRLAVDFSEHDVHGAKDRHHVGEHVPLAAEIHRREMGEARRSDMAAIGPIGAVGHQVDAELALGRLDDRVGLASRHMIALGVELEVIDEGLHRPLHLGARRRGDLLVLHHEWPAGHPLAALLDDLETLAHLLDAHQIAVIAVAVLADRNIEIHLGIDVVGLGLAQIPGHARSAQHRPAEAPVEGILSADDADIDGALLEDAVLVEELFEVVDIGREPVHPPHDVIEEPWGQILVDAARPEIARMHARPRDALIEFHEDLALLEPPEHRRYRTNVEGEGRYVQQMIQDPCDLGEEHADILAARWRPNAEELLDREGK